MGLALALALALAYGYFSCYLVRNFTDDFFTLSLEITKEICLPNSSMIYPVVSGSKDSQNEAIYGRRIL